MVTTSTALDTTKQPRRIDLCTAVHGDREEPEGEHVPPGYPNTLHRVVVGSREPPACRAILGRQPVLPWLSGAGWLGIFTKSLAGERDQKLAAERSTRQTWRSTRGPEKERGWRSGMGWLIGEYGIEGNRAIHRGLSAMRGARVDARGWPTPPTSLTPPSRVGPPPSLRCSTYYTPPGLLQSHTYTFARTPSSSHSFVYSH